MRLASGHAPSLASIVQPSFGKFKVAGTCHNWTSVHERHRVKV
jgi:hypothetical protein